MDSRVIDALRLSCTGLILAGCVPGELGEDDEAGVGTGTSGTSDDTDESTSDDTGEEGALQACGEGAGGNLPGPPRLVSARLDDDLLVRLTFTEPIASVTGVDPGSFRISWPFYELGYGSYIGNTAYYDPMALLCSISDHCTGEYTEVVGLGCAADDPAALLLRLQGFHAGFLCAVSADYPGEVQFLPHFDASVGAIMDLDGEALASIAAHWVQVPELYTEVDGEFPNYPIPIECPP